MCIHCEMINGHELGQTLGDSEGRGSLVCCSARGCKESDTTEQINNSNDSEVLTMMSLGTICPQGSYNTIDHNSLCCVSHPHDLLYNWRFVPLNPLHLFHPPPHPPCTDSQPFILFISESVFIIILEKGTTVINFIQGHSQIMKTMTVEAMNTKIHDAILGFNWQ